MRKVKWALIGCGKVVLKNKTSPFINNKNEIVAICTTKLEHSIEAIKKLNLKNCHGYNDVFKMLKNESIDAIYICTPPKFHYDYLKVLANYNIQLIYVEKPFVLNSEQAESILNLYKNNLTKVFVAHYKRLTPQIKKLKQMIISKKYGKIESIEGYFSRIYNQKLSQNSWIYNKEISGGGRFFDISPHILDVLYYIFGEFQNIKSNVLYEQKEHNCESNVITEFQIQNIPCKLHFDLNAMSDKDFLLIKCSNKDIKTSINRDSTIYILNKKNKITKKYKFSKTKVWGLEAVKELDKLVFHKKYNHNIASLKDAYIIQNYIENIIKETR